MPSATSCIICFTQNIWLIIMLLGYFHLYFCDRDDRDAFIETRSFSFHHFSKILTGNQTVITMNIRRLHMVFTQCNVPKIIFLLIIHKLSFSAVNDSKYLKPLKMQSPWKHFVILLFYYCRSERDAIRNKKQRMLQYEWNLESSYNNRK